MVNTSATKFFFSFNAESQLETTLKTLPLILNFLIKRFGYISLYAKNSVGCYDDKKNQEKDLITNNQISLGQLSLIFMSNLSNDIPSLWFSNRK